MDHRFAQILEYRLANGQQGDCHGQFLRGVFRAQQPTSDGQRRFLFGGERIVVVQLGKRHQAIDRVVR